MKRELAFIILAAGKGTRMNSSLPKVLHKVCGVPMINHVISLAKSFKPKKIITVLAPNSGIELDTQIAIQHSQKGTGDAVKSTKDLLKNFTGDAIILYGDCPLVNKETISSLIKSRKNADISLVGFCPKDAGKYGRLITSRKEIIEIVEFKDASAAQQKINLCNSGIYALDAKTLFRLLNEIKPHNKSKEFYLTDIVKIAAKKRLKTNFTLAPEEVVLGVNTKAELAEAEKIMQNNLRQKAMLDGVTMVAPETVFISSDTKFGKDVTLLPYVIIGENVTIGDGSNIGPFAHIRAGSHIGKNAKVGNFVEIKKSNLGEGVKVSHLSYVGDSIIGKNANLGAGTITCNYDGFDKYKTIIGEGAFIGSNTALVAPITIGKGSIIGAGSTITRNVEADSIAIARGEQKNLAGKALKFKNIKTKRKK